jgi:signal peptidase I
MKFKAISAIVAVLAVAATVLIGANHGLRWFMVETPSMGAVAPRGSLVVTAPVAAANIHVGQIISFHPPTDPTQIYTHRVFAITSNGINTKGDINGAVDGWELQPGDVIGKAILILPAVGWLLKVLPLISGGLLLVWAMSLLVSNLHARKTLRLFGASMVFTYAITVVRPFANYQVIDALPSELGHNRVDYTVVNTGLLPMGFTSHDGGHIVLADGQVGVVHASVDASSNFVDLGAHLALQPWQLLAFGLVGSIPLIISILHYLQSRKEVRHELA